MGWRDILKSEDLVQELEVLFRGFPVEKEMTPQEESLLTIGAWKVMEGNVLGDFNDSDNIKTYIRSMKFMQDFPEIKRDGLGFVMSFKVYDQTFTLKNSLFIFSPKKRLIGARVGIGDITGDTFPESDRTETRICIKPRGIMTSGDIMVAILLASKNDELPPIITLHAYVERFFPQLGHFKGHTIFNDTETDYKITLIREILKKIERLPDEEIPDEDEFGRFPIDDLNKELEEYVPKKLLEGW